MDAMASISGRVGDLGAYLREQRENAKLSVRQLATLAGVSNPYLSQVERGLRRPSAEVLQQIAKGLQISAEALYVRAGILTEEARGGLEAAIDADEGLTPRQKKVLRELCAHFRSENVRAEVAAEEAAEKAAALADAPGDTPLDTPIELVLDGEPTTTATPDTAHDAR
jgi:transcriptional regulator with XRE-family HTH domain